MNEQMMQALNSENIQIIPYGIDMDLFKPVDQADARSELKLPQNIPLVFFPYDPARALKRYDLVEQAVASVCKVLPDVRLISIYDKPQPVVAQYMNACDTLVLASDWEGAPVTIREAMACNLPIVSVDVGDAKQIIGDTDGCYICERTADDIALNLLKVLKARKRTNGRQAVNVYSVDKATEKVTAIYQQLAVKNQLRSQN